MPEKYLKKNEFHDIRRFPKKEGIIVFAISLSRSGNAQNAKNCFEYMENLIPKINLPLPIGRIFLYIKTLFLLQVVGDPLTVINRIEGQSICF